MAQKHSSSPFIQQKQFYNGSTIIHKLHSRQHSQNVPPINISFKNPYQKKITQITTNHSQSKSLPKDFISSDLKLRFSELIQNTFTRENNFFTDRAFQKESLTKAKPKSLEQYNSQKTINRSIQKINAIAKSALQQSMNSEKFEKISQENNLAHLTKKMFSVKQQPANSYRSPISSQKDLTSINYQKFTEQFSTQTTQIVTIQLQEDQSIHEIKLDAEQGTTDQLIAYLKTQIQQNSQLIGFYTAEKNIPLDYYLWLKQKSLKPLSNKTIKLLPLFRKADLPTTLSLRSFHFLSCIGVGGFSRVYLVRSKESGQFLALKLISKQFIIENQKQSIVQNERDVMCQLTSSKNSPRKRFICQLECAFETRTWVCFGMEYCQGGELFNQLRKVKRMTEDEARFYFIQVVFAISFLHDHHVLYRDIKPENIMIDEYGMVKLADFGLARPNMTEEDEAYSFCGSPEYMAPEMLKQEGHNYTIDFYCLGALLYELITGLPPFYSRDTNKIFKSVLNEELNFPDKLVSSEAKDLIRKLLAKDPEERLRIIEILKHPWITKLDTNKILMNSIKPPFEANLKSFNFDPKEFKKGEKQFNTNLAKSLMSLEENKFRPLFTNFYYKGKNLHSEQNQIPERNMSSGRKRETSRFDLRRKV